MSPPASPTERESPPGGRTSAPSLIQGFRDGRSIALARVISAVEDETDGFESLLHELLEGWMPSASRIGVTGPPGAGKSTLVGALALRFRAAGEEAGILAVDPSSPFSGGALLGDRIRSPHFGDDPGTYFRSMASRGSLGGLATTSSEVLDVMDAFGFTRILVETMGVGQAEIDVAGVADSVVVVLVPESGDAIQVMKAGLMEVADLYVINKADRPGAERLADEVRSALRLRETGSLRAPAPMEAGAGDSIGFEGWDPSVVLTDARSGEGVEDLLEALERHRAHLLRSGRLDRRRTERIANRIRGVLDRRLIRRGREILGREGCLERAVDRVRSGESTPYSIVSELLEP